MIVRFAGSLIAATLFAVLPVTAARAEEATGDISPARSCTAIYPTSPTCEFVTTGPVRYAAAGAGSWRIDIIRFPYGTVRTHSGNLSDTGSLYAEAGDLVHATTTGTACTVTVWDDAD